jgi:cobalt/nickel transport protein
MALSNKKFFASAIIVSTLLAGGASFYASSSPDGLEKVAEDIGFIETAKDHSLADSALADYGLAGVDNERLSVGASGVIGVLVTSVAGFGLFMLIRKKPKTKNR